MYNLNYKWEEITGVNSATAKKTAAVWTFINKLFRFPHPDSELCDVDSFLQSSCGFFFSHFGDEVLSVVGSLRLHGSPDRSAHAAALGRWSS